MSLNKLGLFLFAILACEVVRASPARVARDTTADAAVPDDSSSSGDRAQQLDEEEDYWQEEQESYQDQGEQDYTEAVSGPEDRESRYEAEREFQEGQQDSYAAEGDEDAAKNRADADQHKQDAQDHYGPEDFEYQERRDETAASDAAERYEDRGGEEVTRPDQAGYDSAQGPTFGYNTQ